MTVERNLMMVPKYIAGTTYWMGLISGTNADQGNSIVSDSSGNIYVCGNVANSLPTYEDIYLAKYDASGVLQWQRRLNDSGGNQQFGYAVKIDSAGNPIVLGSNTTPYVIKYNSSGTLQWQTDIWTLTLSYSIYPDLCLDSSDNIYINFTGGTSPRAATTIKLNSSGTLQWSNRYYFNSSQQWYGNGIVCDSSGNTYAAQYWQGSTYGFFLKRDSSGTLSFELSTYQFQFNDIAISGSAIYLVGRLNSGSPRGLCLMKTDTSGSAPSWSRVLYSASQSDDGYSVAVDSSGNIYVGGLDTNNLRAVVAKYNSSGTIQWQRHIYGTSNALLRYCRVAIDSSDNLLVTGSLEVSGSNQDLFIAKLPNDGSKTGAYTVGSQTITYAASSLTDASSSQSLSSYPQTNSSGGQSGQAGALTSSTASLTSNVTTL